MDTYDLIPKKVGEAFALKRHHPPLSANDCFCLVTARTHTGILLTGDSYLRRIATRHGLQVHGVLWVIDKLSEFVTCDRTILVNALNTWKDDVTVFLPGDEILKRLNRYTSLDARSSHDSENQ